MATSITFSTAMDGTAPVLAAVPSAGQVITATGTSQATTITAQPGSVCCITTEESVWVAFGTAPVAAAGTHRLVLAGTTAFFGHVQAGWKAAVITA